MPIAYKCRGCGVVRAQKWTHRCPGCGSFYDIRTVNEDLPGAAAAEPIEGEVISLQDAIDHVIIIPRIETGITGIDYVFGGGIAKNSLTLLCGDPGVGKTSLLIQMFQSIAKLRHDTLYVTGEQTVNDIALRAKSFGKFAAKMVAVRETELDSILDIIDDRKPEIVAIDSVQTLFVDDDLEVGSAMSIKVAIREFMKLAKDQSVAIVLVGHITKGGAIGGPKALEYFVDVNLYFSGRKDDPARILKCDSKNRFGPTPRHADFTMTDKGLKDLTALPDELKSALL